MTIYYKNDLESYRHSCENKTNPENIVKTGIEKVNNISRDTLRTILPKLSENVIPFVSTHNPKNPEIFSVIKSNMPIIQQDERLKRIFTSSKFIKSKRQPNNLKKILTRAKFDEILVIPDVKKM